MRSFRNILLIVPCIVMISWLISDWFGGIIIYLVMYGLILIPFILLYFLSLIELIYYSVKHGIKKNLIRFISHSITILFIMVFLLINTEFFKSSRILTATLDEDIGGHSLILRENGRFESITTGMFSYKKTFRGKYHQSGDTIIFTKQLDDKSFIPDSILLDKNQNAIFIEKDNTGNFVKEKQFLNHYKILKEND